MVAAAQRNLESVAGTRKLLWDEENILLESDTSDVAQVIYTLEPAGYGNLISQRRSTTTSFFLFDALGSTRKLTSSAAAVTDSYDFKAYGEANGTSGSTVNVYKWVGELGYYLDVDRLAYYLRARPYSPRLARFVSEDVLLSGGASLVQYVLNSPTKYADPTGRYPVCCTYQTSSRYITETVDCGSHFDQDFWTAAARCCKDRADSFWTSTRVEYSRPGSCNASPPPYDPCNDDWASLDYLDCLSCCVQHRAVHPYAAVPTVVAGFRVWKGASLSEVSSVNIWNKACTRYSHSATLTRGVRFFARGATFLLIAEGIWDVGLEAACASHCGNHAILR